MLTINNFLYTVRQDFPIVHSVTVIGSPGCGKTTAIHHVALKLSKEQLYDVVPAVYHFNICSKQY
jgi:KaiC/GvpD/RAD55 family RecA-like ATPase